MVLCRPYSRSAMSATELLNMVLGPAGALVIAYLWLTALKRERDELRKALDTERQERLKDAKDTEMLARALLKARLAEEAGKDAP